MASVEARLAAEVALREEGSTGRLQTQSATPWSTRYARSADALNASLENVPANCPPVRALD
jgi:hypothetical protein